MIFSWFNRIASNGTSILNIGILGLGREFIGNSLVCICRCSVICRSTLSNIRLSRISVILWAGINGRYYLCWVSVLGEVILLRIFNPRILVLLICLLLYLFSIPNF